MTEAAQPSFSTSITVDTPVEKAFKVFTEAFDTWWPRSHHIGSAEMVEAVMEPHEGGRWYEKGVDGSECEWGRVLVWDPPGRVALSWHLTGQFQYEPDPEKASRVEVTFTAAGPATTVVELTHSELDRHDDWVQVHSGVTSDGGWPELMRLYSKIAA